VSWQLPMSTSGKDDKIAANATPPPAAGLSRGVSEATPGHPRLGDTPSEDTADKHDASEDTVTDGEEGSSFASDTDADSSPEPSAAQRRDEGASAGVSMELGYRPRRPSLMQAQTRRPSQTCGFDFEDLPMPKEDFSRTVSEMTAEESAAFQEAMNDTHHNVAHEGTSLVEGELRSLRPLPFQHRTVQKPPKVESAGHRIAIVVNGSLGDVQPIVAVALQLALFGHQVRVFTSCNLVDYCNEHGLEAVPIFADSQAVISGMGGMTTDLTTTLVEGSKISQVWLADHKDLCVDDQDSLTRFRPHMLLAGVQALTSAFKYEAATRKPVVPIFLSYQAFGSFRDYASVTPMRPSLLCLSSLLETRSVEPLPLGLHWIAECVLYDVPLQKDLQESGKLAQLRRFLGTGRPPVAVGWGSVTPRCMKPIEMFGLALRALRAAGARGVVIGGWAELDKLAVMLEEGRLDELGEDARDLAAYAGRDVCFIDSAPHEWLFPQCCSIVHHGGVGTWQAAVRAGKPAVITPIFADQFDHAAATERLGVGIGFRKPLQETTPQELANAISRVEARAAAAEAIGQKMRSKVGERDAAVILDDFVRAREQKREEQRKARRGRRPSCTA